MFASHTPAGAARLRPARPSGARPLFGSGALRPAVPPRSSTLPGSGSVVEPRAHLGQHLGMVLFSSLTLAATTSVAGLAVPLWAPAAAGACLGGTFAALHRHAAVRLWRPPSGPLRLVVTGGTRGLGKALARQALLAGDSVIITGRSAAAASAAAAEITREVAALREMGAAAAGGADAAAVAHGGAVPRVFGVECDVSDAAQVRALGEASAALLGGPVDAWVINAGQSGSFKPFLDADDSALEQVVRTNLLGGLLCAREAARRLSQQPAGGHVFFMDGAGSDGGATPYYAAYGSTKAALPQLARTLRRELRDAVAASSSAAPSLPAPAAAGAAAEQWRGGGALRPVGVHVLSPGMMITDLLLEGASHANKQARVFNILCEHPETVAAFLVPRLRSAVARGDGGSYTRYLTPASAVWRFLTAPGRVGRFFDAQGRPAYAPEGERILGAGAAATARAQAAAAARGGALRAAYSLSVAAGVLAVVAFDAVARAAGGQ
ncbi:MAG: hypothetical protein J3K34DRAFT_525516 [Monoraphidium minutum]|nr:MAG: hypothetical protein J3K34DRAFT_525516 [Monoraphidium minutum]